MKLLKLLCFLFLYLTTFYFLSEGYTYVTVNAFLGYVNSNFIENFFVGSTMCFLMFLVTSHFLNRCIDYINITEFISIAQDKVGELEDKLKDDE